MNKIYQLLFTFDSNLSSKRSRIWLAIAIAFSLLYSFIILRKAFDDPYTARDDARQHVFWMRRFLDRELFPNDLIADYFQSVAPLGYKLVYAIPAQLKIDPLFFSKILPGILGLITIYYSFAVTIELLPIPFAGFVSALLLNQNLWLQNTLVSGTPKAFAIPLLLAFLYYFLKQSLLGISLSIILCGLFYPSLIFICSGLLVVQLLQFKNGFLGLEKQNKRAILFHVSGLFVAFIVLLHFDNSSSQ
ncbi:MAG: hypothetical protein ACFCAD_25315 [Pleurocapsa sp.]